MSPVRWRVWNGTELSGDDGGVIAPDNFVMDVTQPTSLNARARGGVEMQPVSTNTMTINQPGVYAGIRQPVRITADNVTLTDFDIRVPAGGAYGVFVDNPEAQNVRVQFGTIWSPLEDASLNLGFRTRGGVVVHRVTISGLADGMQIYTSPTGSVPREIEVAGCYISNLALVPDPGQPDGWSHNDAIQIQGNGGFNIHGNTLYGGRTSGVIATTDIGTAYLHLKINHNWIYPHETEGAGVNIAAGVTIPNLEVRNNRFGRKAGGGELSASAANRVDMSVYSGNTYMDNGAAVPVKNG